MRCWGEAEASLGLAPLASQCASFLVTVQSRNEHMEHRIRVLNSSPPHQAAGQPIGCSAPACQSLEGWGNLRLRTKSTNSYLFSKKLCSVFYISLKVISLTLQAQISLILKKVKHLCASSNIPFAHKNLFSSCSYFKDYKKSPARE